jgi:hypothetical protein
MDLQVGALSEIAAACASIRAIGVRPPVRQPVRNRNSKNYLSVRRKA